MKATCKFVFFVKKVHNLLLRSDALAVVGVRSLEKCTVWLNCHKMPAISQLDFWFNRFKPIFSPTFAGCTWCGSWLTSLKPSAIIKPSPTPICHRQHSTWSPHVYLQLRRHISRRWAIFSRKLTVANYFLDRVIKHLRLFMEQTL